MTNLLWPGSLLCCPCNKLKPCHQSPWGGKCPGGGRCPCHHPAGGQPGTQRTRRRTWRHRGRSGWERWALTKVPLKDGNSSDPDWPLVHWSSQGIKAGAIYLGCWPPMTRIATFAARAHKSALEMRLGTYLSVIGFRRPRATSGKPALAPKVPSPPSVKRMAALGQPPFSLPSENTPASCQDRRIWVEGGEGFSGSANKLSGSQPQGNSEQCAPPSSGPGWDHSSWS